eukprot:2667775-Rhodomonas_salina.1
MSSHGDSRIAITCIRTARTARSRNSNTSNSGNTNSNSVGGHFLCYPRWYPGSPTITISTVTVMSA